jgi:hypothetical protein
MGRSSPRGGRPAVEVAKERSASSAQAFIQAGLLFPEDEEERIECFEMALEEILKVCLSYSTAALDDVRTTGRWHPCRRGARHVSRSPKGTDHH